MKITRIEEKLENLYSDYPDFPDLGIKLTECYIDLVKELNGHTDIPAFVDYNGKKYLVTNPEAYLVAKALNKEVIWIDFIEDATRLEIHKFIIKGIYYKEMSHEAQATVATHMHDYLMNDPDGKQWASELPGIMRQKIAELMNFKEAKAQYLLELAKEPAALKRIDSGESTLKEERTKLKLKSQKKAELNKNAKHLKKSSTAKEITANKSAPTSIVSNVVSPKPFEFSKPNSYPKLEHVADIKPVTEIPDERVPDSDGNKLIIDDLHFTYDSKPTAFDLRLDISKCVINGKDAGIVTWKQTDKSCKLYIDDKLCVEISVTEHLKLLIEKTV